jgi:tripartite-type tricarboxylate transporter receptor subunit TctC
MRKLFKWAVVCALLAAPALGQAQGPSSYPDRPIRLVVAFVAGGATDTLARQISNDLKEALGQTVVVENRPGANGYLAWNHVASSEPDGYTLLLAENALGISQALHKKATSSFDPLTQYDAIAAMATSPSALVVATNVPANTVAELVALSRTVSQKMNYASAGVGSVSHLSFEVFKDGSHSYSLQGRRPGDRRRDRRARSDGDDLGAGCQEPGGERQDQGPWRDQPRPIPGLA